VSKYLKTKTGSLESAVLEAVSAAQQAAIAIAKKEKGEKPKNEKTECPQCEGKGCDHCDGKGYHEQVNEDAVSKLAKDFEKRITKGALASDRTQEKERMAILKLGKK
jgi:type II secretory ATPase GspE/PulE/Tfp pilus assembly ATPase PilB-like protein